MATRWRSLAKWGWGTVNPFTLLKSPLMSCDVHRLHARGRGIDGDKDGGGGEGGGGKGGERAAGGGDAWQSHTAPSSVSAGDGQLGRH